MKLAIIVFCLSLNWSYAQSAQQSESKAPKPPVEKREFSDSLKRLRNDLSKIQFKIDSIGKANESLKNAHENLTKHVDDTRLRESLRSAESTINVQNSWLTGFGTLYTYITIVLGFVALVISFIQITSIRTAVEDARIANRDARNSVDSLRDRIQEFDKRIEDKFDLRFEDYSKKLKANQINQIINDMTIPNAFLRDQACFRLTSFKRSDMDSTQINRLLTLLRQRLAVTVEETVLFFITRQEN